MVIINIELAGQYIATLHRGLKPRQAQKFIQEDASMFCYQCEQTAKGEGCTVLGVCGKDSKVAALQDLLIYGLQGLSQVAVAGRKVGVSDPDANVFTLDACFSTLTNVDFDPQRFVTLINQCVELREKLKAKVKAAGGRYLTGRKETNPNVYYEVKYTTPEGIVFDVTESGWKGAVKEVSPTAKAAA